MSKRMKVCFACLLFSVLLLPLCAEVVAQEVADAIVKIYSVYDVPDYYNPWNMMGPRSRTGSGAIIEGNRILTNAHVVSDVTFLQLRRHGETKRFVAHVEAVSHQSDLALLRVEDESFFSGMTPLELGELPCTYQEVRVYGFPLGGDTLSITRGVISRIEHQPYVHSSVALLAGQIDAAINPGNSGGPVIVDGKVVGVVMQSRPRAQNIGYMVPTLVIRHFFKGLEEGRYRGFPSLGVLLQNMENQDIRRKYHMQEGQSGVLVTSVLPASSASDILLEGDVVFSINGYDVANDGTVEFRPRERTSLAYAVQNKQVGESIEVVVWREAEEIALSMPLRRTVEDNWLVPMERYETDPTYYIYGGLVFSPLSKDLLSIWGTDWYDRAPRELVAMLSHNFPESDGEQVVVILRVLAATVNEGYQHTANWVIERVNGKQILNMAELVNRLEADDGETFVVLETSHNSSIVLDRQRVQDSTLQILSTYRIARDRSLDLR